MSKKEKSIRHGNPFEGIFAREAHHETDAHRVDAIEHLRREIDVDIFRDVIGDVEHE